MGIDSDKMEFTDEPDKSFNNRQKLKLMILPFLAVMALFFAAFSLKQKWPGWTVPVFIFSIILTLVYFFLAGKDSPASRYTALFVFWCDLIIYSSFSGEIAAGLPLLIMFSYLLSFFDDQTIGIINIIVTAIYFTVFLILFSLFPGYYGALEILVFITVLLIETLLIFSIKARLREEAAFRETLEKLSDSQSAKDDFLANVSHELRTPLNTVVGVSEHLADSQVPDDMRRDVNDILTAGKNLMYMVSDIVDFTELHSGKIFLVENDYSLIGIVDDLKKMADFWNQEKGLELKFDLDPNICRTLKGDSQKIYRILLCLTNNAIKFTSSGNVHVKAEGRREGDLENLLITIADTGRGMSSDEIDKLDEVYNQLDTTRSREEGGIGLGIPISAKLVEAMNGFMHFESRKGKGTKVTIVLPQKITDPAPLLTAKDASDEHEKPEESGRSIINDTSTPAILVVDDSKMNLRVAQMELKKFGFTADTAQSGPESIKMVRQNDYKLIFMDHMMPEMDGVQTLNEIRKLDTPVSATVPIVALTANALGEAREMLLAAGFSDFISKPIERSQMERVLKKFMHYGEN